MIYVKSAAHRRAFLFCEIDFGSAYFCLSGPFMIQR